MKRSTSKYRINYHDGDFLEKTLKKDPIDQFHLWLVDVLRSSEIEPNAMTLSTASLQGHPSSRTVLLKKIDVGFVFFTNYLSRKGEQIALNPHVSLTFFWKTLHRQVNIEGVIKKTTRAESEKYFASRPKNFQYASIASEQSEPLSSREELEEKFLLIQQKYQGKKIPCPKHWGGYRVIPTRMEFWQGRKDRLHDRFVYIRQEKEWLISRLYP